ncbi:MAG: response regulator transcription factor [Blautia sp.]|uniref:response regulator n=1 Tax=Blautia sp. TaxID=1955243 RepID=UPI0025868A16|nr:response regulator transcription factor [Blautia sp.]MCI7288029.1 response regulator transcription factor [Blautia sp.]MDY5025551.1 response regulator transcription factor [Oliverpabstia sp.]
MNNSNILVVEDDFAIRSLITTALETENYKYHVAKNGKQAIIEATTQSPELILLDLGLPDIDGIDVIKKIRSWSTVPITVISARSEDKDKIDALDAGADDYITKPFSTAELLARIRGNYRRIQYIQNNQQGRTPVFHNGSLTIDYQMQTVYVKEEEIHVTPIEYKILCLLAKNLGRVLTHTHITKEIWGSSLEGDIASLRVHVATVRKKIEKKDSSNKCIQTHVGIGYCMVKQE